MNDMKNFVLLGLILLQTCYFGQVKNLVMEGGGVRGIAYVGAIKALEESNLLMEIENIAGTSVGGITAALLCVGYTSEELEKLLTSMKFTKFNDGRGFFIGGSNRLVKKYGWYRGERLTNWLNDLMFAKTGVKDITFAQLKQLCNEDNKFKNLSVSATNLTLQNWQILNAKTFPNMRIADAVRISASIPLYFTAVFMDNSGNLYERKPRDIESFVMADGGFISNYPIHIYDSTYKVDKTLGLLLDSESQIAHGDQSEIAPYEISNLTDYIGAFYNLVIENLNRQSLSDTDWNRTISISTCGIGPKIKKMKVEEISQLINAGYTATKMYLSDHK